MQPKLRVGPVDSPYEREADRIGNEVLERGVPLPREPSSKAGPGFPAGASPPGVEAPPGLAHHLLGLSGGLSLPDELRASAESRLGRDLRGVRIHTGGEAGKLARQLDARAFTVGRDVVFGDGEYHPETRTGRGLVVHELVHVAQQASPFLAGGGTAVAQRKPDESSLTKVEMTFDGVDLIVLDDGTEIARFSATSGRPTPVKEAHAKLCGGTTDENYVNNPRYVAIKDHGAIPEGRYTISPTAIESFTTAEQVELLDAAARGEKNIKIGGTTIHAGDWGRGRVLINPVRVEPGPKPCTKTSVPARGRPARERGVHRHRLPVRRPRPAPGGLQEEDPAHGQVPGKARHHDDRVRADARQALL
jgi:hypothetical protein